MKQEEFFFWWLPATSPRGRPRRTTYQLTRQDAAKRFPGALPDLTSREVRAVFENRDEAAQHHGNRYPPVYPPGHDPKDRKP